MNSINRELICPHCRKNEYQILAEMRLIIESTKDKGLVIDDQVTNDLNEGVNPFFIGQNLSRRSLESPVSVEVNHEALKNGKVVVLCFSEECEGREMKFTDLILNDEARITAKGW